MMMLMMMIQIQTTLFILKGNSVLAVYLDHTYIFRQRADNKQTGSTLTKTLTGMLTPVYG